MNNEQLVERIRLLEAQQSGLLVELRCILKLAETADILDTELIESLDGVIAKAEGRE